ncbi:MAG: Clp protease ClpP [Alistipes sp.]|jgi:ATP-dependent protease ClpP protease subunit|nr:Clp protease ClpP [Alistipes sp.]
MKTEIKIKNQRSGPTTIDIEGTIGVSEEWQFEHPATKVATYEKLRRALDEIARIRNSEVTVNIRSTGGDVGDALLIHDALRALDATITTRCHGYVASAATVIAQAASPGRREISSSSLYLIHNSVSSCEGNSRDFRQNEELLAKTDERIAQLYAARSGRTADEFMALMAENNGGGRWLSPDEALAAGLVDRVVEAEPEPAGSRWRRSKPLSVNSAAAESLRLQRDLELQKMQQRIDMLERENGQMRARPTSLTPKEDPASTEGRPSANENAYRLDAESIFK